MSTDIGYLPVSLERREGPWTQKLSLGYLWVRETPVAGDRSGRETEGAADTRLALGYAWPRPLPGQLYLDAALELKLPTAETSRGLGTGAADLIAGIDLFRPAGAWTAYASLGYRWVGSVAQRSLRDRRQLGLGLARRLDRHRVLGLGLDYRSALSPGGEDVLEWVPYWNWRLGAAWSLGGYLVAGVDDGSPQRALGLQASRHW